MTAAEPVALLLGVARHAPASGDEARRLEALLLPFCASEAVEEFVTVLATYTPLHTTQRGETDAEGLQFAAREALHDLGEHSHCSHGN